MLEKLMISVGIIFILTFCFGKLLVWFGEEWDTPLMKTLTVFLIVSFISLLILLMFM